MIREIKYVNASKLTQLLFYKKNHFNPLDSREINIPIENILGKYQLLKKIPTIEMNYAINFNKSHVLYHRKYKWLSCKPDRISDHYLLKLKYTTNSKLCISYYDWIYVQIMMEIANKNKTIFLIGTATKYNTILISRDYNWWSIIECSTIKDNKYNPYNLRETRQNTPFITEKKSIYNLHPLIHDDLLSYHLINQNKICEKSQSQKFQIQDHSRKYSDILQKKINKNCKIIPLMNNYIRYFENLTIKYLHENVDMLFNPIFAFNDYYIQSFALWKNDDRDKYIMVLIAKKSNKFIDFIVKNTYKWCELHKIPHENYFYILNSGEIIKTELTKDTKLINEIHIPSSFKIHKNGVIPKKNARYYPLIHKQIIDDMDHVTKLSGIGNKRALDLHNKNINTLTEFYNSDELKTQHQENILNANINNTIYPMELDNNDLLKIYDNESFVDAEFYTNRIVTFVSIDQMNKIKKWKLSEFTDEAERIMVHEIILYLNTMDIVYHWGHADKTQLKKAIKRLNIDISLPNMFDVYSNLQKNNLGIPGCWNMKLKNVAKALYENGNIHTFHTDILDGQDMVCQFLKWDNGYEFYDNKGDIIKKILEYNYYDVETMKQIISYIRNLYKFRQQQLLLPLQQP